MKEESLGDRVEGEQKGKSREARPVTGSRCSLRSRSLLRGKNWEAWEEVWGPFWRGIPAIKGCGLRAKRVLLNKIKELAELTRRGLASVGKFDRYRDL